MRPARDNNMVTVIRGGWVVGFENGGHVLFRDGVVAYDGDRVVHIGPRWEGQAARTIDARGCLVSPGLINTHVHAAIDTQIMWLEAGRRDFFGSIGLSGAPAKGLRGGGPVLTEQEQEQSATFATAQVLRSGATTMIESGVSIGDPDRFAAIAGRLGIRAYVACGFQSATWYHDPERGGALGYHWDEEAGLRGLERACDFIKRAHGTQDSRVMGMLMPAQLDTCSPDLLRETARRAAELDVRVQIHAAQYLYEFHEMLRRHGRTPIECLADVGLLGRRLSVAHCLFTDAHPMAHLPENTPGERATGDLQLLAAAGASVAHCALVFARRGLMMHSFDRYRRAGINMAMGTDTFPRDIIQEMRVASLMAKAAEGNFLAGNARDLYNAATLGGAALLGRDDLGRLAPGAKADIIVVNLRDLHTGPINDPIRTLIHAASGSNVERVIVDGREVVTESRVVGLDEESLLAAIQPLNDRLRAGLAARDWQGRSEAELLPWSFPVQE